MSDQSDTRDQYLGTLAEGVWLVDHPNCPRCGLRLHKDDPKVGYYPTDEDERAHRMRLKHSRAVYVDTDGCVVGLGRAVAALNDRLAHLERKGQRYA